jgi:hypothetical protein
MGQPLQQVTRSTAGYATIADTSSPGELPKSTTLEKPKLPFQSPPFQVASIARGSDNAARRLACYLIRGPELVPRPAPKTASPAPDLILHLEMVQGLG